LKETTVQESVRIGIIGDFNPEYPSHGATTEAIHHAAGTLSMAVDVAWFPTLQLLGPDAGALLGGCDGLWASPGSPYNSMEGALVGIRYARERGRPFIGT
jgi:CTP synthase (UTP-ammonia lyase)